QTAATEKVAKDSMGVYEIVHFATHGVLDPVSFKSSYLTMAPFMEEDGKFTMEEIGKMSLHGVNLVTLSACNTAVNENNAKGWINNPAKQ
ncbi:CHAT domain-containing protein, partial [Bacillus cereus group sp. Bce027]|uniref:CHAT domain-containing protein n=1 Tax=Bacillus cereus group sp. Bce027 TaxID=3445241 RepID=UPI003F1EAE7A